MRIPFGPFLIHIIELEGTSPCGHVAYTVLFSVGIFHKGPTPIKKKKIIEVVG